MEWSQALALRSTWTFFLIDLSIIYLETKPQGARR